MPVTHEPKKGRRIEVFSSAYDSISYRWFVSRDLASFAEAGPKLTGRVKAISCTNPPDTPEWSERSYNVQHWTDIPSGKHFAALEEPVRWVEDVRNFFRGFR